MDPGSGSTLDRIRHAWASGADLYDVDPGHGLLTPDLEQAWGVVLGEALGSESLEVLDVGTGTGFLAVMTAQLGHQVTGVDLTPEMLAGARTRAQRAGVEVLWQEGDAMALPFDDASYDAAISRHVLWTMTDPATAFREWMRVVRPGGRVFWFDSLHPRHGLEVRLRRWGAALARRLQRQPDRAAPHHYTADLYGRLPLRGITSTAPIVAELAALGISDVSFRPLRALRRAEQRSLPLYKRIGHGGTRYVGSFTAPRG